MKTTTVEKLLPLANNISRLFAVLCQDDVSGFESETVCSKEGMEQLIILTEGELLGGGYLSVDILKYFVRFNMFVIRIGKASPKMKQLFQETGKDYGGNFLQWFQEVFIDYVADYLSKPIIVRVEHPEETKTVKHFIQLMTTYFRDADKMNRDRIRGKCHDLLFIIPRLENWKEIYLSTFQEGFMFGLDELTDPAVNKSRSYPRKIKHYLKIHSIYWDAANDLTDDPVLKSQLILDIINNQIGKNLEIIVTMECNGENGKLKTKNVDSSL
jgi:hypothetical protein